MFVVEPFFFVEYFNTLIKCFGILLSCFIIIQFTKHIESSIFHKFLNILSDFCIDNLRKICSQINPRFSAIVSIFCSSGSVDRTPHFIEIRFYLKSYIIRHVKFSFFDATSHLRESFVIKLKQFILKQNKKSKINNKICF